MGLFGKEKSVTGNIEDHSNENPNNMTGTNENTNSITGAWKEFMLNPWVEVDKPGERAYKQIGDVIFKIVDEAVQFNNVYIRCEIISHGNIEKLTLKMPVEDYSITSKDEYYAKIEDLYLKTLREKSDSLNDQIENIINAQRYQRRIL